jgi:pSer/pThr/pTyr-binding forkhead associated (FHA) protein
VSEYVLNPAALFLVHDEFEKLGRLRRQEPGPPEQTRPSLDPGNGAPLSTGPSLQVVRGIPTGARHPLGHGPTRTWTIGRDPSCEVVVGHDPYASKRHAEVRWATSGFVLVDLGSTNSTHHNWQALPKGGQVALRHGDIVGVGKTLLVFWEAPGNRRS